MNIFPNNDGVAFVYKMRNWWDWFKAWFTCHSNIIFIDIPPTWCDKSELIRLATFKLLVDFVEKENPTKCIDWDSDDGHKNAKKVFTEAYNWIKTQRPQLVEISEYNLSEWNRIVGDMKWKKSKKDNFEFVGFQNAETEESKFHFLVHQVLEKKIVEIDDSILIDIVKIRNYLWT